MSDELISLDRRPDHVPSRNFEDVISALGPPGRFQIVQCLLLSLFFLPVVFIRMNFVFLGLEPSFSCSPVNESRFLQEHLGTNRTLARTHTVSYERCEIWITANTSQDHDDVIKYGCTHGYRYDGGDHMSIITEWDLVCDKRGTAELTQTALSVGWLFGAFFASTLSDNFGRKKALAVASSISSISELACTFVPNIFMMMGLRFCSGFFASGLISITFVLGAEMLVSKYRGAFGVYLGILWSFCAMLLCGIAYAFRDSSWRDLQLCLALCGISPLIFIYFVEESASWSYSKHRYQNASRTIQKACRMNCVDYEIIKPIWNELRAQENNSCKNADKKAAKDYNILDLFKNNKLRASVLIAWVAAFSNDVAYFGMYLSASTLAGNLYLNTTIMAVLEFPGCLWVLLMLRYKGRRFVTIFFMTMTAICLLVSTCLSSMVVNYSLHIAYTSTAFFLLGRLAISNSYSTIYIYIPELFPTTLRSSGMGICLTGGCVGAMLSPYLLPLHDMVRWAPGTCLMGVLAISILLLLKLPETKGKQLESTIEGKSCDV